MAVAIVDPPRMIHYRVQTNSVNRNSHIDRSCYFIANVSQPTGPQITLGACLGNENRASIALLRFAEHFPQRPIQQIISTYEVWPDLIRCIVANEPLVVRIIVYPDNVEYLGLPPSSGFQRPQIMSQLSN